MKKPEDQAVFKRESFEEIARRAREVLGERGFTDDQIESVLARTTADDVTSAWAPPTDAKRSADADSRN